MVKLTFFSNLITPAFRHSYMSVYKGYGGLNQNESWQRSTESLIRTSANVSARTTAGLTIVSAECSSFTALNGTNNWLGSSKTIVYSYTPCNINENI